MTADYIGIGDAVYSGAAEITGQPNFEALITASRDLQSDLDAGLNHDGKVFEKDRAQWLAVLSIAYPIYLQLVAQGKERWDAFRDHPALAEYRRRPKAGTEANFACVLVAKPAKTNKLFRSACSSNANMLVYARARQFMPGDFLNAMKDVDLSGCKKFVREKRKAAKPPKSCPDAGDHGFDAGANPAVEPTLPIVKLVVIDANGAEKIWAQVTGQDAVDSVNQALGGRDPADKPSHMLLEASGALEKLEAEAVPSNPGQEQSDL